MNSRAHSFAKLRLYWGGFVLWIATVFVLSSISGPDLQPQLQYLPGDKVLHFIAFAVGGFLLSLAMRNTVRWSNAIVIVFAAGCVAAYGVLDEWRQTFTPMRSGGDFGDWLADALGAIFGASAAIALHVARARYRTHRGAPPRD